MFKPMLKACLCLLPFAAMILLVRGYESGPPTQRTGGFGEKSCLACHTDFALNDGRLRGGSFSISGVPDRYTPGETYDLSVWIGHPGQIKWGFQLTSRFSETGVQAGELLPVDDMTQIRSAQGIQYLEHTMAGNRAGTPDGPVEFKLRWVAPQAVQGPVIFNAAGNAADDDGDSTGDFIYSAGAFSRPAGEVPSTPATLTRLERRPERRINTSSRFAHVPAPVDLDRGATEVHIEHRFLRSLGDASPGNAFGVDFGANINLGFNHALTDRLSAGASRTRFDQIIAFAGTYEIETGRESPWQLSLVGGVEGRQNFERHYSPYLQLASSLDYRKLRLHAVPTMVFNSRSERDLDLFPRPVNPDQNHTLSLGVGVDIALNPRLALFAESVPRLAGFGGFGSRNPVYAGGVKIMSWGHVFTIMASTSRTFTPARYAVDAEKDFALGFNIYRRIR